MAGRRRILVLQLHANSIRLLNYVTVRNDVALGIDDDAGPEGALTNRAWVWATLTAALPAKELVEEILKRRIIVAPLILIGVGTHVTAAATARILDRRLGG